MKTINKYFLMALAGGLLSFTACSDDIEREPSPVVDPNCPGVYFSADNSYELELEPEAALEMTLKVARTNTEGAATVKVEVLSNTENVFEVPETITFEAGQAEAPLTIKFPNAEIGLSYSYELKFGEGDYNPYADQQTYVSGNIIRIKWNPVETAILLDGTVANFFGVPYPTAHYVTAEMAKLPTGVTKVRLLNPFAPATADADADGVYTGYPYNEAADMTGRDVKMLIDIVGKEATMAQTLMGFDWGYGEFFCGSVYPDLADDKETYPLGEVSTDEDGNLISIVFGANSLYSGMLEYNNAGAYPVTDPTCIFFSVDAWKEYQEENATEE